MNNNNAKQLTRFPYCRIYRRFLKNLTENHLIRKHGDGLLYRYIVLFALANFRSAIRTINGQRYVMHAGEWVSTYSELCENSIFIRTGNFMKSFIAYPSFILLRARMIRTRKSCVSKSLAGQRPTPRSLTLPRVLKTRGSFSFP